MTPPASKKPKKNLPLKRMAPKSTASGAPMSLHADLQLAAWKEPNYQNHFNVGLAFHKSGYLAQSAEHFAKALSFEPDDVLAQFNLAIALKDLGKIDEADQLYVKIAGRDSPYFSKVTVYNEMICMQHLRPTLNIDRQMEILKSFREEFQGTAQSEQKDPVPLIPHTPLRIGIVSADLRMHPVGYFLESTFEQLKLDPALGSQVQLIAYSSNAEQDEYTYRLSEQFDEWYRVNTWTDERLADQIKRDKVDILMDLGGHCVLNRLPLFAKRVAPVQVSWLGYWGSTGLTSIDYILADPICVPEFEEQWYSEKVWRFPHLRYCFSTPENAPEVSPPPCLTSQQFVFGCYQNVHKINARVLHSWSRILTACPQARLRVQTMQLKHPVENERFLLRLQEAGIDKQRVDLYSEMSRRDYLASYAKVDVLLDTYPYPGGTTTAEALWMGTPTITLISPNMIGRQGEALMKNAGLADWIVSTEDEYVQMAIDWANADAAKRQQLADLRARLREQVKQSPVFNAKQFASELVDVLYGIWQEKCTLVQ